MCMAAMTGERRSRLFLIYEGFCGVGVRTPEYFCVSSFRRSRQGRIQSLKFTRSVEPTESLPDSQRASSKNTARSSRRASTPHFISIERGEEAEGESSPIFHVSFFSFYLSV